MTTQTPLLPHGGYHKLRSYKVAEAVYDATVVFCRRFLGHDRQDVARVAPGRPGVVRLTGLSGLSEFVEKAEAEIAANAMLCATNQAVYLLKRQLESQGRTFLKEGGFSERLYAARRAARGDQAPSRAD